MVLDKTVAPSTSRARLFALTFAGLLGCYSNSFDEALPNVYYCVEHSDCLSGQACAQFRCVDDEGPHLRLSLPESLTLVTNGQMDFDFEPTDFVLSDSNAAVEGEGKVRINIDGVHVKDVFSDAGEALDVSNLEPGAHRIQIQAIYGDGMLYTNPSASDYTAFFIESDNDQRPQVAIVYPPPGHVHVLGEPLQVRVAVRKFGLVDAGMDCPVPTDCDPFDPNTPDCVPICADSPTGHVHVYMLDNYPACLLEGAIGCNGDYVLSMRTADVNESGTEVTGELLPELFESTGAVTLSVGLQYNDHDPFPAKSFVVHDSVEIQVAAP